MPRGFVPETLVSLRSELDCEVTCGATGVGLTPGVLLALAFTRLLCSLIYGVTACDTETFVVVPVVLALVALMATYIPARRTTSIDPMQASRME